MKLRNLQRRTKSTGQKYLLSMNEVVSGLKRKRKVRRMVMNSIVQGHIRDITATVSRNHSEKDTVLVVG